MDIPKNEMEIFEFVQNEHEKVLELHSDLNKDYISHIANNISQRRDFYKNLVSLCGIILGFTPFLFEKGNIQQINLFFSSIGLFILVIVLVINYMRSVLDAEGNEFKKQLSEYNSILYPQMEKRREFFAKGIFTSEALRNLFLEMEHLSKASINLLKTRDLQSIEQKKKERMDYAGEFLVLFFISGVVLLLLSLTAIKFNVTEWLIFSTALILAIFFIPFHNLFVYLGIPMEYINKILNKESSVIIKK